MKKLILIFITLLFSVPCFARSVQDAHKSVIGRMNNVGTPVEYTVYITENTLDFNSIDYSESTVFTGVSDTKLRQVAATTNYGTTTPVEISKYGANDHAHTLISFTGLSNIPSAATVTSVEFGLYRIGGDNGTYKATRVLKNWVVGEATWTIYSTGNSWTSGGCLADNDDRASAASASTITIAAAWNTTNAAGLVTDIQNWVDGTNLNYGWHLERDDGANDTHYVNMVSSEGDADARPYLKVVYEVIE